MMKVGNRDYVWWPDAVSPAVQPEVRSALAGRQITDRYLLGLARRNGGQLVTFDRALAVAGGKSSAYCPRPDNASDLVRSGSPPPLLARPAPAPLDAVAIP